MVSGHTKTDVIAMDSTAGMGEYPHRLFLVGHNLGPLYSPLQSQDYGCLVLGHHRDIVYAVMCLSTSFSSIKNPLI